MIGDGPDGGKAAYARLFRLAAGLDLALDVLTECVTECVLHPVRMIVLRRDSDARQGRKHLKNYQNEAYVNESMRLWR